MSSTAVSNVAVAKRIRIGRSKTMVVTPKQFLKFSKHPQRIKRARFMPPKLGSRSLGKFVVICE